LIKIDDPAISATAAKRTFKFPGNQSFLDLQFAQSRRSIKWMIAETSKLRGRERVTGGI
jgi:hypothetical protein